MGRCGRAKPDQLGQDTADDSLPVSVGHAISLTGTGRLRRETTDRAAIDKTHLTFNRT
jgi:hypothetical protein